MTRSIAQIAKIIIIGPAHPLRSGGLTTFNHRLAREFISEGQTCEIFSFSFQYPAFLFPGTSQFTDDPAPEGLIIHSVIHSLNPLNWFRIGNRIRRARPDIVVVRYWIPFIGPCLGTILRQIRKNKHTRIICIADNIIPHEHRPGDTALTRYFLKHCDAFITMSETVLRDLRSFRQDKPVALVPHPIYDNFGPGMDKAKARQSLGIGESEQVMLFFGFIRRYKGLDLLLEAMANARIRDSGIKLMIAGEYYEEEAMYVSLIEGLGLRDQLILHTHFIRDRDVPVYFGAADVVVQPYRDATQSGVTPLAYHFEKPMIVTRVGGLPDLVPHEEAGLVVEPTVDELVEGILRFFELGEAYFIPHLRREKQNYSWSRLTDQIRALAAGIRT